MFYRNIMMKPLEAIPAGIKMIGIYLIQLMPLQTVDMLYSLTKI